MVDALGIHEMTLWAAASLLAAIALAVALALLALRTARASGTTSEWAETRSSLEIALAIAILAVLAFLALAMLLTYGRPLPGGAAGARSHAMLTSAIALDADTLRPASQSRDASPHRLLTAERSRRLASDSRLWHRRRQPSISTDFRASSRRFQTCRTPAGGSRRRGPLCARGDSNSQPFDP